MEFLLNTPIAHRGLHNDKMPENTMPAFRAAIEKGYAIETDVRWTKDDQLIIFHDETLKRVAKINKRVRDCTLEQLRKIRLNGEHIPLFSELLEEVNGRVPLLIEIKHIRFSDPKKYIGQIESLLAAYNGSYAIQSFQPMYVRRYKKLHPEISCGVLAMAEYSKWTFFGSHWWRLAGFTIKHMSLNFLAHPDFISYRTEDLPRKSVEKFKGKKFAWVVRGAEEEARVRPFVDNIIFENYLPETDFTPPPQPETKDLPEPQMQL